MKRIVLLAVVALVGAGLWYRSQDRGASPSGRAVKVGTPVTGALGDGDLRLRGNRGPYQVWTLKGRRGQKLSISMTSTAFDPYLYLRTAEGLPLGADDDGGDGLSARINTILPRTGSYTVVAASVGPQSRGDYTLTVAPWLVPDAPRAGSVPSIAVDQTLDGVLEPGDELSGDGPYLDRWTFEASEGARLRADMRSSDVDSYLMVFGPDGDLVGMNDDAGGRDAIITFRAGQAGRYTLVATSFGDQPRPGAYRVALSEFTSAASDPGSIVAIDLGETKTGALEGGDSMSVQGSFVDVYTFRPAATGGVVVDVTSRDIDPVVTLLDSAGVELARDDDSGEGTNARLSFGASAGTPYRLVVSTFGGGRGGAYEVRLSPGLVK